jgi:hypothetical protein
MGARAPKPTLVVSSLSFFCSAMEQLLAAAWLAGVVEGVSVLRHERESIADAKSTLYPHYLLVLPPSLVYGTVALPLGIIGASPGIAMLQSVRLVATPPLIKHDKATGATLDTAPTSNKFAAIRSEDSSHIVAGNLNAAPKNSLRRLRAENRRVLEGMRPGMELPLHYPPQPPFNSSTTTLSRVYFATLDGRPLPTPFAEAMRRTRSLLIGASLVVACLSHYQQRQPPSSIEPVKEQRESSLPASVLTIEERNRELFAQLVNEQKESGKPGVVIRLVQEDMGLGSVGCVHSHSYIQNSAEGYSGIGISII